MPHWREAARPIIAEVLKETAGQSEGEIRAALRKAFPWPPRSMYPYKIWLDEVRVQRGLKKAKPGSVDERQMALFEED